MSSMARKTAFPRAATPVAGNSNAGCFGRSDSRERDVAPSSTRSTGTVVFVIFLIIAASERHLYTRFRLSGHIREPRATAPQPMSRSRRGRIPVPKRSSGCSRRRRTRASARTRLARHRTLYNADCNTYFYNPELWHPEGPPYSARAIQRFVDRLADSGIDTLMATPNTQVFWYPSRKLEKCTAGSRRGDRDSLRAHADALGLKGPLLERYFEEMGRIFSLILDLEEAGVDWLAETAAACRRRGVAPWLSFRMNDTHGAGNPESGLNCRLYRDERYRLSGRVPGAGGRCEPSWIGLNYTRAEVRRYMFELIREGIEDYDFDGVE